MQELARVLTSLSIGQTIIAGLILAILVELLTIWVRFGLRLRATQHTRPIARLTFGIRVHHGYPGVLLLLVAFFLPPAWQHAAIILGLALAVSDLLHHFAVLWPITGSPEFDLTYPPPVGAQSSSGDALPDDPNVRAIAAYTRNQTSASLLGHIANRTDYLALLGHDTNDLRQRIAEVHRRAIRAKIANSVMFWLGLIVLVTIAASPFLEQLDFISALVRDLSARFFGVAVEVDALRLVAIFISAVCLISYRRLKSKQTWYENSLRRTLFWDEPTATKLSRLARIAKRPLPRSTDPERHGETLMASFVAGDLAPIDHLVRNVGAEHMSAARLRASALLKDISIKLYAVRNLSVLFGIGSGVAILFLISIFVFPLALFGSLVTESSWLFVAVLSAGVGWLLFRVHSQYRNKATAIHSAVGEVALSTADSFETHVEFLTDTIVQADDGLER